MKRSGSKLAGLILFSFSFVLFWVFPNAVLAAPTYPATETPVLPDPVELVIGAAITFLVVNGLKDFSRFVGHDLNGWGTVIAAGATAIVIFSINTMLQMAVTIDPSLVDKLNAFFQIVVILLGAMGFKRTLAGSAAVGVQQERG